MSQNNQAQIKMQSYARLHRNPNDFSMSAKEIKDAKNPELLKIIRALKLPEREYIGDLRYILADYFDIPRGEVKTRGKRPGPNGGVGYVFIEPLPQPERRAVRLEAQRTAQQASILQSRLEEYARARLTQRTESIRIRERELNRLAEQKRKQLERVRQKEVARLEAQRTAQQASILQSRLEEYARSRLTQRNESIRFSERELNRLAEQKRKQLEKVRQKERIELERRERIERFQVEQRERTKANLLRKIIQEILVLVEDLDLAYKEEDLIKLSPTELTNLKDKLEQRVRKNLIKEILDITYEGYTQAELDEFTTQELKEALQEILAKKLERRQLLIQQLKQIIKKYKLRTPPNIETLTDHEINELYERYLAQNTPRTNPLRNYDRYAPRINVVTGEYPNPYGKLDIDTNEGFEIVKGSMLADGLFYEELVRNSTNPWVIKLFTAIRYYIIALEDEVGAMRITVYISYFDEIKEIQIDKPLSLPRKILLELKNATTVHQINNIINSFDEYGGGSDSEIKSTLFAPNKFLIAYRPRDVEGGGLKYQRDQDSKHVHIFIHESLECVDPPNEKDNCLIEAFRYVLPIKTTAAQIRSLLKLPKSGMLKLSHIPKLERYFNLQCCVITGKDPVGDWNTIYGDAKICDFGMLYREKHFSLIRDIFPEKIVAEKKHAVKKQKKSKQTKAVEKVKRQEGKLFTTVSGLDFETIFDDNMRLRPYSFVTKPYEMTGQEIVDQGVFYAGTHYSELREEFMNYVYKFNKDDQYHLIVTYNGAGFDHYLLGEILAKERGLGGHSLFFAKNKILKVRFANIVCIDLCRFLMTSLKDACLGFGCELQKLEFDYEAPQAAYFNDELEPWIDQNREPLKDYNTRDVTGMMELFFKVRPALHELTGLWIENFMTLPQMAYTCWRKEWTYEIIPPPLEENKDFCRSAMIAGRAQIFRKGCFEFKEEDGMNSIDVKSQYPFVMYTCVFPTNQEIRTPQFVEGKLGIYNVRISKQPVTKIIPNRLKGKALDWEFEGEFEVVLTTVDIQVLDDFGAEFEIVNMRDETGEKLAYVGVYWQTEDFVFKSFVHPLKEAKTQEDFWKSSKDPRYNPARRGMIKLLLNALGGKVGQQEYDTDVELCYSENQIETFIKTHTDVVFDKIPEMNSFLLEGTKANYKYSLSSAKPAHLAAFIYSYARSHLYRSLLSKSDLKFATDTDCGHLPDVEIDRFRKEDIGPGFGKLHFGGEFGDFEPEVKFNVATAYYIAPKFYGLFSKESRLDPNADDKDEKTKKMRAKGINVLRDKLLLVFTDKEEEVRGKFTKEFNALDASAKFKLYNQLPKAMNEDFYRHLASGKHVAILSSQITKKRGCEGVTSMLQNYLIKIISPCGEVHN